MTIRDSVSSAGQRARGIASGFTPGQIAVVVFGVIGLVVVGLLYSRWSAAPYSPLFSNLAAADASAIVQQLDSTGVSYQLSDGGATILVPADKVYQTRLAMSGQGLPASTQDGYALLDQQGITTSEFMQNVAYQRALEGELAKTISSIDGVENASVHLAIPQKTVFTDEQDKTTASVLVGLRTGSTLSADQVQSVTNLVASSVPGLNIQDVTVADSTGALLTGGVGGAAGSSAQAQVTAGVEKELQAKAQSMLDRLVGAGNAVVRVNATLDFDQRESKSQTYAPPPAGTPALKSDTSKESFSGTGNPPSGVVGANGTPTVGTNGQNTYTNDKSSVTNAVGSVIEQRTGAPGTIKRLTVAVLLNSAKAGTVNALQVQDLVANAVGFDATRQDNIKLERMAFDDTAAEAAKKAEEAAQSAAGTAAILDLAKKVGIILLVLAVLGLAFLSSRRQRRSAISPAELAAVGPGGWNGSLARADDVGYAGHAGVESEARPALDRAPDEEAARRAREREDVGELVARQPEEVAQLLRGWLADRRP